MTSLEKHQALVSSRTGRSALLFLAALLASPPANADCKKDADCKGGKVCASGQCKPSKAPKCTQDGDCAGDAVCVDGHCAEPSEPPPARDPSAVVVPVAPVRPPPPPPSLLTRISFQGLETEVSLGPGYACTAPCTMDVPAGNYQLSVGGSVTKDLVVPAGPPMVVRVRGGSSTILVVGVIALVAGAALIAGGAATSNNCQTPAASSSPQTYYCVSIPLTLELTGGLWAAAGVALSIVGGIRLGKPRVDVNPKDETVGTWAPRVVPWARAEPGLRGGTAGLGFVF
jgi:hypothetical protein